MSELLGLLQAGDVEAFNKARPDSRIELFAEELAELALTGVDLSHVVLDKSDLTETNLTDAHLIGASMNDIDGTKLVLDGAIALGLRLRDAWMEDADLTGADLSRADLSGAVLHRSKGEGVRLLNAKLRGTQAHQASWPLADFSEANLKEAELQGADLSRSRWTEASATSAVMSGADLSGADAAGVKLSGAKLDGANLRAARMPGAQLAGADLSGADLRDADLTGANLVEAVLTGADLRGTVLADATLDGATLDGAQLDGADLAGVDTSALGLSEAQRGAVARAGAVFDEEAALTYDDVDVVRLDGGTFVALWRNEEDEGSTIRWARCATDEAVEGGVLAVRGERVLHHAIVGTGAQAQLHVLTERPDGVAMLVWRVGLEGGAQGPEVTPMGYEPAVTPLVQRGAQGVQVVGLARRGPTLVVHREAEKAGPMEAVGGRPMPTARGFVGRRHPVLLGKGGVVQRLDGAVALKPVAVPDGFPSRPCDAVPVQTGRQERVPLSARASEVLLVWVQPAKLRDPGGVRAQRPGLDEEPERVGLSPDVLDLEAQPAGEGAWVAWIEQDGPDDRSAMICHVPGGRVQEVAAGSEPWLGVRLVDVGGDEPLVVVRSLLGRAEVRDISGKRLAWFGQRVRFNG